MSSRPGQTFCSWNVIIILFPGVKCRRRTRTRRASCVDLLLAMEQVEDGKGIGALEVLKKEKSSEEFRALLSEQPDDEIAVLGKIATDTTLEFLFPNAKSMCRVVGVGLDYSHVILSTKLSVTVFGTSMQEWLEARTRALDESSGYLGMVFKFPVLQPAPQPPGELLTGQEASRKFGVGLEGTHVYYSYAGGGKKVVARCPLLWELAIVLLRQKYEEEDHRHHHVQGLSEKGETESTTEIETKSPMVLQDRWSELLSTYYKNGEPVCGAPRGKFRKIEQRVAVHPMADGSFTNMKNETIDPPLDLADAQISAQFIFNFSYNSDDMGNERKIEVTNRTKCDLGEHGFKVDETDRFGWYQDDVRISLQCKEESNPSMLQGYEFSGGGVERRLAENSSIDDDDEQHLDTNTNVLHELEHSNGFTEGLLISKIMEEERATGDTAIMEKTFNILGKQNLGGFCALNHSCGSTVTYTLMFKTTLPDSIWRPSVRKSLLNCGLCLPVWGEVMGSWELLNEVECASYQLKVERRLQEKLNKVLPEEERTYRNDMFMRNTVRQMYKVPLFVNHTMSYFLVR